MATRRTKQRAEPTARGISAHDVAQPTPDPKAVALVERSNGQVLATYRDPLGGHTILLVAVPIEKVVSAPFQRDLSDTHTKKLADVMDRLDRYLDPVILVEGDAGFWTPNGAHRLEAMRRLGARSLVGLLVPEHEIAYQILALNTEKAPNLKDRALEVIRLARVLSNLDDRAESAWAAELSDPTLLTLGPTYEARPRFSGSAYHSVLKRIDPFLDLPLSQSLKIRAARTEHLLALDDAVGATVAELKTKGFTSPNLKGFVISRISSRRAENDFTAAIANMTEAAKKFDVGKVAVEDLAAVGGGAPAEEE
ncbi:MAG: chromosome partitioning protein ParB [Deltaproteobacteria bacterium]|nr:chromosome partitioning protein ParB [Deltaproteobacteria bacterium]